MYVIQTGKFLQPVSISRLFFSGNCIMSVFKYWGKNYTYIVMYVGLCVFMYHCVCDAVCVYECECVVLFVCSSVFVFVCLHAGVLEVIQSGPKTYPE